MDVVTTFEVVDFGTRAAILTVFIYCGNALPRDRCSWGYHKELPDRLLEI